MNFTSLMYDVGKTLVKDHKVAPIYHMLANAAYEITLSKDGMFVGAIKVAKTDRETFIPCTAESSNARTGTLPPPHPFDDQIQYLTNIFSDRDRLSSSISKAKKLPTLDIGEIDKYVNKYDEINPKKNIKINEAYLAGLKNWHFAHPENEYVSAVYTYLKKDTIFEDLLSVAGIGSIDPKGLVRWVVITGRPHSRTWEDPEFQQAWQDYYSNGVLVEDEISGGSGIWQRKHPKSILFGHGNGKYISSHDKSGFTFRGERTHSDPEMASADLLLVSTQTSHYVHAAIRYLFSKEHGVILGKKNPDIMSVFLMQHPSEHVVDEDDFNEFPEDAVETISTYRDEVHKWLYGSSKLPHSDTVIMAVMGGKTDGRVTLKDYCIINAGDYYRNLETWMTECSWNKKDFTKTIRKTPSLHKIIHYAYGNISATSVESYDLDDIEVNRLSLLAKTKLYGNKIPRELITSLASRINNKKIWADSKRWREYMWVLLSVLHKYYIDYYKEDYGTMLEPKYDNDVSYQYGRLMAVLQKVEEDAYGGLKDQERVSAVQSNWGVYMNNPKEILKLFTRVESEWFPKIIKGKYPGNKTIAEKLIWEDIMPKLNAAGIAEKRNALEWTTFFGYYAQRQALFSKGSTK